MIFVKLIVEYLSRLRTYLFSLASKCKYCLLKLQVVFVGKWILSLFDVNKKYSTRTWRPFDRNHVNHRLHLKQFAWRGRLSKYYVILILLKASINKTATRPVCAGSRWSFNEKGIRQWITRQFQLHKTQFTGSCLRLRLYKGPLYDMSSLLSILYRFLWRTDDCRQPNLQERPRT